MFPVVQPLSHHFFFFFSQIMVMQELLSRFIDPVMERSTG